MMTIKQAAETSGVSAKMIRHYEAIGLIDDVARTDGGYRIYAERDVHTLRFIRRARDLGFAVDQMRELLALWRERERASADVKRLALDHVAALELKAHGLQAMIDTLRHLADSCTGDDRPDCPILEGLCEPGVPQTSAAEPVRFGPTGLDPVRQRRAH